MENTTYTMSVSIEESKLGLSLFGCKVLGAKFTQVYLVILFLLCLHIFLGNILKNISSIQFNILKWALWWTLGTLLANIIAIFFSTMNEHAKVMLWYEPPYGRIGMWLVEKKSLRVHSSVNIVEPNNQKNLIIVVEVIIFPTSYPLTWQFPDLLVSLQRPNWQLIKA